MDNILFWSCTHNPYNHPETLDFILSIKNIYNPSWYCCLGDERDCHSESYHEKNPDLWSSRDELEACKTIFNVWMKYLPQIDFIESNHGQMYQRKAATIGISKEYLRPLSEIIHAPNGWKWEEKKIYDLDNGTQLLSKHQIEKNSLLGAQRRGLNTIQGHYHTELNARYFTSNNRMLFGATAGCLIDNQSNAFRYNKNNSLEPCLGAILIRNCSPLIIPMFLDSSNKWLNRTGEAVSTIKREKIAFYDIEIADEYK